jgi:hypothetical protein
VSAAAATALGLLLAAVGIGAAREEAPPRGEWKAVAASPLSPRSGALAVWTGSEVLVLGGSDAPPCPPNADCSAPVRQLRDGAAYNPLSNIWRPIPSAPVPIGFAQAAVADDTVFVWSNSTSGRGGDPLLLAYRPTKDEWERLPTPRLERHTQLSIVSAGRRLVAYVQDDERDEHRDLVFDLGSSSSRELPPDPLGPSLGRTMAWSGDELILVAYAPVANPNSEQPWHPRAAAYDFTTHNWRRLPDPDQLARGPWFPTGDGRLVNPTLGGSDGGEVNNWGRSLRHGGILDPAEATWSELPNAPSGDEFAAGVRTRAGTYFIGASGWLLDLERRRWQRVPELPQPGLLTGHAVVGAGDDLFLFGGARWRGTRGELTNASWLSSPAA